MPEKTDPHLRLHIAVRDLDPEGNPDDFSELVAAILAYRNLDGALEKAIAHQCGFSDPVIVHHWANGVIMPTPKFRREVAKYLRGRAAELGVKDGG